ncbi:CRISPR system precrRNA processing endoribonuclease RAMP protein Cas6 [Trichlorobacter ammonificans]|uniref:CRISPR system precrRNA processing endoribonuclease RAMP protein Cas6 n=1 Tax=Trichlorobacter ammonificans TaxID=2916410 RepID=UPI002737D8C0|nr:CRISPR system precrRNA processing endoribonuclease RAMP protein Cas6 [Trichlorobacter ammonificans]
MPHLNLLVRSIVAISGGVCRLQALDYQKTPVPLVTATDGGIDNLPVLDAAELMTLSRPDFAGIRRIRLKLLTPLRLLHNGRELNHFEPELFVRALLRRISALAACYGERADPEWFRHCAARAADLRLDEGGSSRAPVAGDGRGVLGSYLVSGPWQELGPLLVVGSLLHLGKGAAYGRGAFQVTPCA